MVMPLLAAGAKLLGGSALASLAGGLISGRSNRKAADKQAQYQYDFAKHGVRWKVADAKAAGIHPLYALGASTQSYSPISVGDSVGPAIAQMGQDISRAQAAGSSAPERGVAGELLLERARLENQNWNLRNQLLQRDLNGQTQVGPPFPTGGDGFTVEPAKVTAANPYDLSMEAGPDTPGLKAVNLGKNLGGIWKLPGSQLTEQLEDMGLAKYAVIAAANEDKIPGFIEYVQREAEVGRRQALAMIKEDGIRLLNLYKSWAQFNKPKWVKDYERRFGRMFTEDGRFWQFVNPRDNAKVR